MKTKIKPSMRTKRRYLLIEGSGRGEIEKLVLDYLGVLGWAKASPVFVEGGKEEGKAILSVSREQVENIRAAFEMSRKNIKILKVSGTIKGVK